MNELKCNANLATKEQLKFTCAACGSTDVKVRFYCGFVEITCPKCGTSFERPIADDRTDIENAVDTLNEYEHIRYEVNKSKMEVADG